MEIRNAFAVARVRDAVQVARTEQRAARGERIDREKESGVDAAGTVGLIDIAIRLAHVRGSSVIRKFLIGRRAADFKTPFVIVHGRADPEVHGSEAWVGTAFDDLVDVAGDAGSVRIGRRATSVDLQLLL